MELCINILIAISCILILIGVISSLVILMLELIDNMMDN